MNEKKDVKLTQKNVENEVMESGVNVDLSVVYDKELIFESDAGNSYFDKDLLLKAFNINLTSETAEFKVITCISKYLGMSSDGINWTQSYTSQEVTAGKLNEKFFDFLKDDWKAISTDIKHLQSGMFDAEISEDNGNGQAKYSSPKVHIMIDEKGGYVFNWQRFNRLDGFIIPIKLINLYYRNMKWIKSVKLIEVKVSKKTTKTAPKTTAKSSGGGGLGVL